MTGPRIHLRSRAFALPLVVLLILIAGLTVALLVERHGVSYRAITRNIDTYRNHHRAAGIKECILRWLDTARGRVSESLDESGLAFTMDVSREGQIKVYMQDAQGAALSDPSALAGRRREIVEDMKFLLDQVPEEMKEEGMFRPVGPPEISIDSAPEVVLRALCLAVIGDLGKANKAAGALIAKREAGRLRAGEIQTALTDVQIEEQQRREISAMLVATPTLYKCVAETTGGNDQVFDRSEGLYLLDETRNDTFKQGGSFLTWEQVPVDRRNDLHR